MGPNRSDRKRVRCVFLFTWATFAAAMPCWAAPAEKSQSISQSYAQLWQMLAWTGVKVVKETLAPAPGADPSAPVAVAGGLGGRIYVQWNSATAATVSRFDAIGNELTPDPAYTMGGRAGRALAVPACVNGGHQQDCALLAVDRSGPDVHVRDCMHSSFDFSPGSSLGMIIGGGGARAFLAARYAPTGSTSPSPALAVTPVQSGASSCGYLYDEQSLYANPADAYSDGYGKGRLVSLAGVPSGFIVGAASRLGPHGMVVAGTAGKTGPAWVVSLDEQLAPLHQGSVAVGGNVSATVTSVAVDGAGNVFVCGTSRSRLIPFVGVTQTTSFEALMQADADDPTAPPSSAVARQPIPTVTEGWVAQGTGDLQTWTTLTLPLTVDGCAWGPSGELIVSGTYDGVYQGQASQARDAFLARVTPGTGGTAPTLAAFARHGTNHDERVVSAPFVASRGVFLAGVTLGDWGDALGVGQPKVFVARFDPVTLALQ
jgi:hypothetical protein